MPRIDGTTGVGSMLKHEVRTPVLHDEDYKLILFRLQFANYPLQRLMKHTTGALNRAIIDQVAANLTMFRHSNPPYTAKHLVAVEKLLLDSEPSGYPNHFVRRYEDHYVSAKKY